MTESPPPNTTPADSVSLPELPEPTEIEIELTNFCNAKCIACPRSAVSASKGYMSDRTFQQIIEKYGSIKGSLQLNKFVAGGNYPFISIAGLGEPTLHPRLPKYLAGAVAAGFRVTLFTNVSLVNEQTSEAIVQSGIERIYVSFWGIEATEYAAAMGLDYARSLSNLLHLADLCRNAKIDLLVCWIQTPLIKSSPHDIVEFWHDQGIAVDMSEYLPWNRGGYLRVPMLEHTFAYYQPFDFSKSMWCSQFCFTDTITWEGKVVLCSQDYFERKYVLGDVSQHLRAIGQAKRVLLDTRQIPSVCITCRKPSRNYTYASAPWDSILDDSQRASYFYQGDAS